MTLCLCARVGFAAEAVKIGVHCEPTDTELAFRCVVRLHDKLSKKPVTKGQLTLNAEMPSMPLAHHVSVVRAEETNVPGEYAALVRLEMYGRWAIRVDVEGVVKAHHVHVQEFRPPREKEKPR
jgi:hypothetical protein